MHPGKVWEISDLIPIFQIVTGLAKVRGHHIASMQIKGSKALGANGKGIVMDRVTIEVRNKSFVT